MHVETSSIRIPELDELQTHFDAIRDLIDRIEIRFGASVPVGISADLPWMVVARGDHGLRETRGGETPGIMEAHQHVDPTGSYLDEDEDAWCASWASWTLHRAAMVSPRTARARGFLEYGIPIDEHRYGCLAVLWRGSPDAATGHVGFVVDVQGDQVVLLGGNQSDRVQFSIYPRSQVLGWRWPVPVEGGDTPPGEEIQP